MPAVNVKCLIRADAPCLPALARRSVWPVHAVVVTELTLDGHPDRGKLAMGRVEDGVLLLGHEGGGDIEDQRAERLRPAGPEVHAAGRGGHERPVARKL